VVPPEECVYIFSLQTDDILTDLFTQVTPRSQITGIAGTENPRFRFGG
jgi:hypothetical protein